MIDSGSLAARLLVTVIVLAQLIGTLPFFSDPKFSADAEEFHVDLCASDPHSSYSDLDSRLGTCNFLSTGPRKLLRIGKCWSLLPE